MALNTVHLSFSHGMMLGQAELSMDLQMTRETGIWFSARVDNELFAAAANRDVLAPRTVAGFTSGVSDHLRAFNMDACVRTRGENPRIVCVAIDASFISNQGCACNLRWRHHRAFDC
jgi:hypothetical protein